MSAYNELMSLINKGNTPAVQQDEGKSLINKTLEVLDKATSQAYGVTVKGIGAQYEAAKMNIIATPKLFNVGREQARERTAEVLLKLLSK